MDGHEGLLRAVSRAYAVLVFLGSATVFGGIALLMWSFGFTSLRTDRVPLLVMLAAAGGMALTPLIWRRRTWAMAAALLLALGFFYWFGSEMRLLTWLLGGATALFASFTGILLWFGEPRRT